MQIVYNPVRLYSRSAKITATLLLAFSLDYYVTVREPRKLAYSKLNEFAENLHKYSFTRKINTRDQKNTNLEAQNYSSYHRTITKMSIYIS